MNDRDWYLIDDLEKIDSPALLLYFERIKSNLQNALYLSGDVNLLRPHVKTSKISEVCALMMEQGVTKFKCATIAEAEMLAIIQAPDVLLAYQPVGPKLQRFLSLINNYPDTYFSCLVDNEATAAALADAAESRNITLAVFIDLNIGMNRTGANAADAVELAAFIASSPNLKLEGLHAYDGHINDTDLNERKSHVDAAMELVYNVQEEIENRFELKLKLVAGGTPTFPIHASRQDTECSPGTFIFWDQGYSTKLPDLPFHHAAVLITRVVSIVDAQTICTDLGHKSVASEMPFPRVEFLNAPGVTAISQSEEHLTLTVTDSREYKTGDLLYAVPTHVCPTIALYDKVYVVEDDIISGIWKTVARNRSINI